MTDIKQKIVPHLWFDKEAKEAAEFYTSIFPNSKIVNVTTLHDTPSGDVDTVTFEIMGYKFMAISAGPLFTFNPSISIMVNFDPPQDKDARGRIDEIWEKLSEGGKALMPLDKYQFSERYGWIQDKYGFSWQLIYTNPEGEERPLIIPSLLFVSDTCDKAEEATDFYLSVFKNAKRGAIARYPAGMPARRSLGAGGEPNKEGAIMFTDFTLEGQWFAAMDRSADMHSFSFNEAISFMVYCKDQKEIDYYWEKLSAVPEADLPAPRPGAFYVYVILCDDDSMYIGQTGDLKKRWREHESGRAAGHTKRHKADRIIHFEEFSSREEAVNREHDLKTGFGRKWLKREYKAGRTRQAGQCGWLKDKYGVSWQIVPAAMDEMTGSGDEEKIARVTEAFLKMKKFDIAALQKAYEGR